MAQGIVCLAILLPLKHPTSSRITYVSFVMWCFDVVLVTWPKLIFSECLDKSWTAVTGDTASSHRGHKRNNKTETAHCFLKINLVYCDLRYVRTKQVSPEFYFATFHTFVRFFYFILEHSIISINK